MRGGYAGGFGLGLELGEQRWHGCVRHERQRSALPAGDGLADERARRPRFAVGRSEAV